MTGRRAAESRRHGLRSRSAAAEPSGGQVPRMPLVVAVLLLIATAAALGDAGPRKPLASRSESDPVAMPAEGARSSAWYCPGGPGSDAADVREAVTLTNVGDTDTSAAVTVLAGGESTRQKVAVPAGTVLSVRPQDLSDAPHPGVIVEPFSGEVVVEHGVWAQDDNEIVPCATQPSAQWYFANGTTERGAELWLLLFNPFGDDAIVDISFFTDEGRQEPEGLRGFEVPRRSSVAVKVHEQVRRQHLVATVVDARVGRVVAEQSQLFLTDSGRTGITRSLGAVEPSLEWWFASGYRMRGGARSIGIANPGDLDTEVDIQVVADGDAIIEPVTVALPSQSATSVVLGACGGEAASPCVRVPSELGYSVVVSAVGDLPVVAESIETWTDEDEFTGATSLIGSREPARQWVFGRSRIRNERGGTLVVLNSGSEPVEVSVSVVLPGGAVEPSDAQGVEIAPGDRWAVRTDDLTTEDAGLVVTATGPVMAERLVTLGSAASRAAGVPDRG